LGKNCLKRIEKQTAQVSHVSLKPSMKKIFAIALFSMLITFAPVSYAATGTDPVKERVANMTSEEKKARAEEIKRRVYEIKDMDKSNLSREERKALRKELREMKKEARAIQGIYLSVGAIIIIILLLILIL
jgi:hypothetical protein